MKFNEHDISVWWPEFQRLYAERGAWMERVKDLDLDALAPVELLRLEDEFIELQSKIIDFSKTHLLPFVASYQDGVYLDSMQAYIALDELRLENAKSFRAHLNEHLT